MSKLDDKETNLDSNLDNEQEESKEILQDKDKNITKKIKKEKKPITMKKIIFTRILFLIIFIAIAIGLTFYLASKKNPEVQEKISNLTNTITETIIDSEKEETETKVKTLDWNGTYDKNSIVFNYYTVDIHDNEIEYIQIDGLKDDAVEIEINNKLKNTIVDLAKNMYEENPRASIYSGSTVYSNFANIISINSYVYSSDEDEYYKHEDIFLNFSLIDGKELTLDDIFSSDFAIEEVLVDKLYEAIIQEFTEMDEDTWNLYISEEAEDIEEKVYSIVSDYQRGKKVDFYLTPQRLEVKGSDYGYAKILFKDYYKYITIYDKFLTDSSIYDGQYEARKNIPNLTDLEMGDPLEEYIEEEKDNYYINAALYKSYYDDIPEKVLETASTYFYEYIEEKTKEEIESGVFTIYNINMHIYENVEDDIYGINIEDNTYNTTKSKYKNVLKKEIKEFFKRDFTEYMYYVGNLFLTNLNYDEEIIKDGNIEYEFREFINYEDIIFNYSNIEIDKIGNIITADEEEVILEIVD